MPWLIEFFARIAESIVRRKEQRDAAIDASDKQFLEELEELDRAREISKIP